MIGIKTFFDNSTSTFTYVVYDPQSKDAIVIDPVVDFTPESGQFSLSGINEICNFINSQKLMVRLVTDTHVHADHITGTYFLKKRLGVESAIGQGFIQVQEHFAKRYQLDMSQYERPYDHLLSHNQQLSLGTLRLKTLHTPGHTPSCCAYLIDDALFSGDALFKPEMGCGRTDFPGGCAQTLYRSITEQIYTLPDHTRIFVGHDYPKDGQEPQPQTSVFSSKTDNVLINQTTTEQDFVKERTDRDQSLAPPRLQLFCMQINILGGQLPDKNFLKIPITVIND